MAVVQAESVGSGVESGVAVVQAESVEWGGVWCDWHIDVEGDVVAKVDLSGVAVGMIPVQVVAVMIVV